MSPRKREDHWCDKNIVRLADSFNRDFTKIVSASIGIRQAFLNDDIMLSGEDLINAVSALEEEFGIDVGDEDYKSIQTIGDARDIIMDLVLQKAIGG